jgi:predicted 3-demethylubiquinone-9 3-methyltransferase (glyoxalase superfamily)
MAKLKITPFFWFVDQAEDAAKFYASVFKRSKVKKVTRYTEAGQEIHGRKPGSAMTVELELEGQPFTCLNGGPVPGFDFSPATSFVIHCANQKEVDHYWKKLTAGGDPKSQQCGWLKDKFGVTWQVVPDEMLKLINGNTPAHHRAMNAMMKMKKLDLPALKKAYAR